MLVAAWRSLRSAPGLIYPLKQVTSVASLGVVYLVGVVIVSAFWGLWLGLATSILSAAAFNFFHLPPVGQFTIADSRNWVALAAFLVAAVAASTVSERARLRAAEAESRRAEADLIAEIAQLLLARAGVDDALVLIGRRLARVFELPWATIALGEANADPRRLAIPLAAGDRTLGTLVVPASVSARVVGRLRGRVVPALSAMLAMVARARATRCRGGPDRGPAAQRGRQDRRPACRLTRPALSRDRDDRRRLRGARPWADAG